ncbi:hypothetical protein KYB31_09295 [Clostridium felsineum]|uniref:hypothetical protein n=1 Tax=Clostridium felsineum TaxID=36839 RepID=UPI00214D45CF|nr:hypothetical protein [Clostridium felsineum]MCR3759183.1 hypothetical protein [Clostridium felsineum]
MDIKVGDRIKFSRGELDRIIASKIETGTITRIYGLLFKKYIVVSKDIWGRLEAIIISKNQIVGKDE